MPPRVFGPLGPKTLRGQKVASFLIHLYICDIRTIGVDDHFFLHAVLESDSSVPV